MSAEYARARITGLEPRARQTASTTRWAAVAPHAVVIGAGFGGMAAALRLRAKGYRVTLLDRCLQLGGRAQVFERDGFRHDAGPTVITAPFLFDELFALFGERFSDHVALVPLTPWYRFCFADGDHFDYGGTLDETLAEIGRISASGWHTCAMVMRMMVDNITERRQAGLGSPGLDELRWLKPVYPGDTLRVETTLLDKTQSRSRPEMGSFRSEVKVFNQHDALVATMKSIGLIRRRN